MQLRGSIALVTGGAVRIGRSICEALASKGCAVAVHCNNSLDEAMALCAVLEKAGVSAWTVRGDLSTMEDCDRIVREVSQKAGGFNILINNASVFYRDNIVSADESTVKSGLNVNLLAPLWLTRSFVSQLNGSRGKIINLLDRRIKGVDPEYMSYQLSKKMLAELTISAAVELAPGITVNGIAPGAILPPVGVEKDLAGDVPLDHKCTVKDVADAAVYLLESDAVTGQIIYVDGGRHLR